MALGLVIAAVLILQDAPATATQCPCVAVKPKFEDKFLTFSQAVLVVGAAGKIVASYSRDPGRGSTAVVVPEGLAGATIAVEALAKNKMSTPVKYIVGTGNIVAGVVLGIFAHHDTAYTRAVIKGGPPPTY
jgi:hypothetical protein